MGKLGKVSPWNKPWLWLSSQKAHDLAPYLLKTVSAFKPMRPLSWRSFDWRGLHFTNPMGIAGGVDKNADQFLSWQKWGCGFTEIGTITPEPQAPNPGLIMSRNLTEQALWNKMGFPSQGLQYTLKQLQKGSAAVPLFANIGKNRNTPLEEAHQDYNKCLHALSPYVDAFTINISSPNTQGLRELLKPENIKKFLQPIIEANQKNKPLLLKVSPDMENQDFFQLLDTSYDLGIDGWILTNTLAKKSPKLQFPDGGGVSGAPLAPRSKEVLSLAIDHLKERRKDKLIISCGGILSPHDAIERLEMGADLIQFYTALVFHGPFFFKQVTQAD